MKLPVSINTLRFDMGQLLLNVGLSDRPEWLQADHENQTAVDIRVLHVSGQDFMSHLVKHGYVPEYGPGSWTTFLAPSLFSPREFFRGNPLK